MPMIEVVPLAELLDRCSRARTDFCEYLVEDPAGFSVIIHCRYYASSNPPEEGPLVTSGISFVLPLYRREGIAYVVMDVLQAAPSNVFWPPYLLDPILRR